MKRLLIYFNAKNISGNFFAAFIIQVKIEQPKFGRQKIIGEGYFGDISKKIKFDRHVFFSFSDSSEEIDLCLTHGLQCKFGAKCSAQVAQQQVLCPLNNHFKLAIYNQMHNLMLILLLFVHQIFAWPDWDYLKKKLMMQLLSCCQFYEIK